MSTVSDSCPAALTGNGVTPALIPPVHEVETDHRGVLGPEVGAGVEGPR